MKNKNTKKKPVKKAHSMGSSNIGLVPLGDRVLVKPLSREEMGKTTPSGIIIPDTVDKKKPEQGTVVAVGPGKWNEDGDARVPMNVKVGDHVYFSKPWEEPHKINGVEYYFINESDILAVVQK